MNINIKEPQLEHLIYSHKDNHEVIQDKGLTCFEHNIVLKQLNLGSYGRLDLVGAYVYQKDRKTREIEITVYELKQKVIGTKALRQAARYVSCLKRYISDFNLFKNIDIEYKMVLIGETFDDSYDFCFLASEYPNSSYYTYNFGVDGLSFKEVDPNNYFPADFPKRGYGKLSEINPRKFHKDLCNSSVKMERWIFAKHYFAHFD